MTSLHERFLSKVQQGADGECWEWTGAKFTTGYGNLFIRGGQCMVAHRYSWLAHRGPYDQRLDLDHLCRNRGCVNPDHLEPVTRQVNLNRSPIGNLAKTLCPHGHEYDEANTYRDARGSRFCRACMRKRGQEYRARKRAGLINN